LKAAAPELTRAELEDRHLAELHALASAAGIPRYRTLKRRQLVDAILGEEATSTEAEQSDLPAEVRAGVLDIVPDGFGFLRVEGLGRSDDDAYVSRSLIRSFGLRSGDEVEGPVGPSGRSRRYPSLLEVNRIDGHPPEEFRDRDRPEFEKLTPIAPRERIQIASPAGSMSTRMVDLLAATGKGQRCLISSPPGAGATTLLRDMASGLVGTGALEVMVVLVDVRPEEITEWRRAVDAPVHGAASDRSPETHVRIAELALERAKRRAEEGKDVVLLLDSLTRLARARSLVQGRSRRPRPDDDPAQAENPAVRSAKRWFSAARNTQEHGSLTIAAVARTDSESEFEQLVYELLADNANMELRLDQELARAGLFPALDVNRSWSHLDAEVVPAEEAAWVAALRRSLISLSPADAWDAVAEKLRSTSSNSELFG
jgi:transcription termination factor Rho